MGDWTSLITVARVKELHALGIDKHGKGTVSPPILNCIEGGLGNAWSAECYKDQPELVRGFIFATRAYVYLETRQCFQNGNKRAAWATMMDVLNSIGVGIECTDDEAEAVCLQVAAKTITAEGFTDWVISHATDIDASG